MVTSQGITERGAIKRLLRSDGYKEDTSMRTPYGVTMLSEQGWRVRINGVSTAPKVEIYSPYGDLFHDCGETTVAYVDAVLPRRSVLYS